MENVTGKIIGLSVGFTRTGYDRKSPTNDLPLAIRKFAHLTVSPLHLSV